MTDFEDRIRMMPSDMIRMALDPRTPKHLRLVGERAAFAKKVLEERDSPTKPKRSRQHPVFSYTDNGNGTAFVSCKLCKWRGLDEPISPCDPADAIVAAPLAHPRCDEQ